MVFGIVNSRIMYKGQLVGPAMLLVALCFVLRLCQLIEGRDRCRTSLACRDLSLSARGRVEASVP